MDFEVFVFYSTAREKKSLICLMFLSNVRELFNNLSSRAEARNEKAQMECYGAGNSTCIYTGKCNLKGRTLSICPILISKGQFQW